MQLDQLIDQGQADAGPFQRPAALPLDPMEAVKDVRQLGFWDANPGIANRQRGAFAVRRDAHEDAARQCVFERIRYQVENNTFPHFFIDINRLRQSRAAGF